MVSTERKASLRRKLRAIRANIAPAQRDLYTRLVTAQTLHALDWSTVQTLHIYTPHETAGEFATTDFLLHVRHRNPTISLETSSSSPEASIPNKAFDAIIIPCLGASKDGYRLGNGGGWYDRFLAGQKNAVKIGWCLDDCLIDDFPVEPHDQQLTMVITEKQVITVL